MKRMFNTPRAFTGGIARFALLLLVSTTLYAEQGMSVVLSGAAEVPPVTTVASGSGEIAVLPDHPVSGKIKVAGFAATAAHVHEGAAGKNGPVVVTLSKVTDDTFAVPPGSRLSDAQYASYLANGLYVNVHSAANPGGEVRGQLKAPATPKALMRPGY